MRRSGLSEEQIIGILKEHEAGVSVADLCRKHAVSDASIYKVTGAVVAGGRTVGATVAAAASRPSSEAAAPLVQDHIVGVIRSSDCGGEPTRFTGKRGGI